MAQWPVIYNRLLVWLPALSAFTSGPTPVYDGPPDASDQTPTFMTVGYVQDEDGAGSFSQERAGNGFQTVETGTIRGEVYAGNGDGDLAAARAAAFALVDAIQAGLVADQTLGVLPQGASLSLTVDPRSLTEEGAAVYLPLSINYVVTT